MRHVLVPIESGSCGMSDALAQAIRLYRREPVHLHLLNVQPRVTGHAALCFSAGELHRMRTRCGREALAPAEELLGLAGVPCDCTVETGATAETIARFARRHHCDTILLGDGRCEPGFNWYASLAQRVRQLMEGSAERCSVL